MPREKDRLTLHLSIPALFCQREKPISTKRYAWNPSKRVKVSGRLGTAKQIVSNDQAKYRKIRNVGM
jgi:hypothetical protein